MSKYFKSRYKMQLTLFILFITAAGFVLGQRDLFGSKSSLPNVVRLGSAIVAAVEEDAEHETYKETLKEQESTAEDPIITLLAGALNETVSAVAARGKYHKQKKMTKYIYSLFMGVILAKTVLIPLLLKLLTAISTSSFVMSKISLAASALLALKWIIGGSNGSGAKDRVEIIHLPVLKGIAAADSSTWNDNAWSNSNAYDLKAKRLRHNYIPFVGSKDISFTTTSSTYRYPQQNYQSTAYDGKPFL